MMIAITRIPIIITATTREAVVAIQLFGIGIISDGSVTFATLWSLEFVVSLISVSSAKNFSVTLYFILSQCTYHLHRGTQ